MIIYYHVAVVLVWLNTVVKQARGLEEPTTDSKSIELFYQNGRFSHGRCKKSWREV
jgi:hypothetical protein